MNNRHEVKLKAGERESLMDLVNGGKRGVRMVKRAQILLAANKGIADETIAAACKSSTSTVFRTKRRYVNNGLEAALSEAPRVQSRVS